MEKKSFFGPKIAIYLSLGLFKGRPSYKGSLQPSKREHQALQKMKCINFFCGSFLPSWIRIANPNPDPIRIRIWIHNTAYYNIYIETIYHCCGRKDLFPIRILSFRSIRNPNRFTRPSKIKDKYCVQYVTTYKGCINRCPPSAHFYTFVSL